MKKIIEVNEDAEKILTNLCDAALKYGGMQFLGTVNQLVSSIKEEAHE